MRRGGARLLVLWVVFLAVHLLTAWLGWIYPSQPMGDVVLVYEPWATAALSGGPIVGITETWVYPQLALLPILLVKVMAAPFVALFGVSGAYLLAWAVLVTALDAVAFAILLGRSPSAPRRTAGWFWSAALLLLGPIALYRLDAITLPLVVIAGLWLVSRPALAAALLTIGAWIKIWPGAVLLAALIAARHRLRMVIAALAVTAAVIATLLLLGAREHLLGFLTQQGGRGLQIEAVAATPFLWAVPGGSARIEYSFEILTFQIDAPGADIVAVGLSVLMMVVVVGILGLGTWKALRGAAVARLFPSLALSLIAALIVTNKVGSPQFQVWLIAPVILWVVFDRARATAPAAVVLVLCFLTCLVYPLGYDALLQGQILPIVILSARNLLLLVILVIGIRAVARTPAGTASSVPRVPTERDEVSLMLIAFSVAPSGTGRDDGSVHVAVAAAVRVVRESGLPHRTTSMFTEIEGPDWDTVMDVVKRATEAVMPFGSRVSLVLKADIRPGFTGELDGKIERLERAIDDAE